MTALHLPRVDVGEIAQARRVIEWARIRALRGPYSMSKVDWIEANVVTEAMVDAAIQRDGMRDSYANMQLRRAKARRNIAIGIRAGSYRDSYKIEGLTRTVRPLWFPLL
jgi:hypothetical protein